MQAAGHVPSSVVMLNRLLLIEADLRESIDNAEARAYHDWKAVPQVDWDTKDKWECTADYLDMNQAH